MTKRTVYNETQSCVECGCATPYAMCLSCTDRIQAQMDEQTTEEEAAR